MKYFIKLHLLLLLLPLISFSQNGRIDSTNVKKLRIDPNNARGASASAFFDKVDFIPLETNKMSLFGEIIKLEIVNGKYVIFDMDTWSVLIFGATGKFITRISAKNVADLSGLDYGKENTGGVFNGFTVSSVAGEKLIDISSKKGILRFDLEGKLRDRLSFEQYQRTINLGDGTRIITDFSRDREICYEFAVVSGQGDTTGYLPYSIKRYEADDYYIGGNRINVGSDPNSALYYGYYSYDIFDIRQKGVSLRYQILLPETIALPKDFVTNPVYTFKKWGYLRNNRNKVYGLRNPLVVGDNLIVTLDALSQFPSTKKTIAYNLRTGGIISMQDITPDESSFFLPVNDSAYGTNFMMKGFSAFDGTNLYTSISSVSMLKFREQSKANNTVYPELLKQYFSKKSIDANPVLVVLKPKLSK